VCCACAGRNRYHKASTHVQSNITWDSGVLNPRCIGTTAALWILILPALPRVEREREKERERERERERELSDLSCLLHHTRSDSWYGSPRLTCSGAVAHTCSAWHMTLNPPPVIAIQKPSHPLERPHTLERKPGHGLMHGRSDTTSCVLPVTPRRSARAVYRTHCRTGWLALPWDRMKGAAWGATF